MAHTSSLGMFMAPFTYIILSLAIGHVRSCAIFNSRRAYSTAAMWRWYLAVQQLSSLSHQVIIYTEVKVKTTPP